MVDLADIRRDLDLFEIPGRGAEAEIKEILARLLLTGNLKFGELQIARDILERRPRVSEWGYLAVAALFLSLRAGNTFMRLSEGIGVIADAGYLEEDVPSNPVFRKTVEGIWGKVEDAFAALEGDLLLRKGEGWYFQRLLHTVERVSQEINRRIEEAGTEAPVAEGLLSQSMRFEGFTLNGEQVQAVKKAVSRRFTVITGGPGTGKTTIVCSIIRALTGCGTVRVGEIALCAPTGRAAKRMSESLRQQYERSIGLNEEIRGDMGRMEGVTIHSLLGGYPPKWKHTRENPLPFKLIVVDEASMIDVELMESLLEALPERCRVILLGDKDQLPSVGTGALLGELVNLSGAVATLKDSQRFRGELKQCAEEINRGEASALKSEKARLPRPEQDWTSSILDASGENTCFWYGLKPQEEAETLQARLREWSGRFGLLSEGELVSRAKSFPKEDPALLRGSLSKQAEELFETLDRSRILALTRRGPFGVQGINTSILKMRCEGRLPDNPLLLPGIPLLITANTPARELYNGDIGVTVQAREGMVALFLRGRQVISCPISLLPEHELAYAITVHKSQGSEFRNVLVVLPDDLQNPLLTRPLLYTAVTRAKRCAVVLGEESVLDRALATTLPRNTGLSLS